MTPKISLRALASHLVPAALAACSVAPAPPAPPAPRPPPPAAAPASAPPPKLSLYDEGAYGGTERRPAAPAELPALTRRFEPVPLPPGAPEILDIDGRDGRDVWMLGGDIRVREAVLLRWDGVRAAKQEGPKCSEKPFYRRLMVTSSEVVVRGSRTSRTGGEHVGWIESRWPGRGPYSCETTGVVLPADVQTILLGSAVLRFVSDSATPSLTLDGRRLPLIDWSYFDWNHVSGTTNEPTDFTAQVNGDQIQQTQLVARSPEDLWLYNRENGREKSRVLRYNGVTWQVRPTGLWKVLDLWVDDTGSAWVLGIADPGDGDGDAVLRWDLGAGVWRRLPTPEDFLATRVHGTSARDVWLLGKKAYYQWDGHALRRGKAALEHVNDVWASPSGELWVVGGNGPHRVETLSSDPKAVAPAGLAFRSPPPEGQKP